MKLLIEATINAPRQLVFDTLSNISISQKYISGIEKIEVLSKAQSGEGFRWRETRTVFGKQMTEEMEIRDFDPPNSYRVLAASHGMEYESRLTYSEDHAGSTLVKWEYHTKAVSLSAKLMSPMMVLFKGSIRKALAKDLTEVKAGLEAETP